MSDINFMINPEGAIESGDEINHTAADLRERISNIRESLKKLDSWHSVRKDEYVMAVMGDLQKMEEIVTSIDSFGSVAKYAGNRVLAAENEIKSQLNG